MANSHEIVPASSSTRAFLARGARQSWTGVKLIRVEYDFTGFCPRSDSRFLRLVSYDRRSFSSVVKENYAGSSEGLLEAFSIRGGRLTLEILITHWPGQAQCR